jgi:regulator of protease activity HflC (stomatin/prohibitin superfamily)
MNIASVIKAVGSFSWLILFALLLVIGVRASRKQSVKGLSTLTIIVLVATILMTIVGAGLVFIEPYEVGVVVTILGEGGMRPEPLKAGLHWIAPFIERVELYRISRQTYTMARTPSEGEIGGDFTVEARTSDGQRIFVDSSVIYQIDPSRATEIHRTWQKRYESDLIQPQVRGTIRDSVSQYRVDEVLSTKRFDMAAQITETLEGIMADNGLTLIDFVLRDITFTEEYAQSIEQKQIAEQQALQAQFVVESKRQEAEQARQIAQGQADAIVIASKGDAEARLINAAAEAEANGLIAASLRDNPELLTYQYITRLSPSINTILVPSDNPYILPIPGSNPVVPTPAVTTP